MGALCIFCNRRIGKGHIGLINAKNIPPCNANQTIVSIVHSNGQGTASSQPQA